MLTEFGELGFDYSINWCPNGTVDASGSCRLDPKPIRWDYLQNNSRKKLHDLYSSMMRLRTNHPQLATANSIYSLDGAFKYLILSDSSVGAVVMGNFDVNTVTGTIPFPSRGTWYNYFGDDSVQVTGNQNFTLAAGEYRVYLDTKTHDSSLRDTTSAPVSSMAIKIYPNPVMNGSSVIEYDLPEAGSCSISIVNSMGQMMGLLTLASNKRENISFHRSNCRLIFHLFQTAFIQSGY